MRSRLVPLAGASLPHILLRDISICPAVNVSKPSRTTPTGPLNILAIKLERHGSSQFSADEQDGGG